MKVRLNSLFFLLAIIGLVSAWWALPSCTEKEQEEAIHLPNQSEQGIQHRLSSVYIPISYELQKLETLVNQKIKGTFLKKKIKVEERKAELYLEFTRTDRIRLKWNKQTLRYEVPMTVTGYFKKKTVGITIKNQKAIEARVIVTLASTLDFDENWQLKAQTELIHLEWKEEPQLNLAFISLNLRGTIENYLTKNDKDLLASLDKAIVEVLPLQKVVFKLWEDIQKPILINRQTKSVWLKSVATDMQAEFVPMGRDKIGLGVRLQSFVFAGTDTLEFIPSNGIPPLNKKVKLSSDSLDIYILASLKLEEINRFLNQTVLNKPMEYAGYSANLDSIVVYGSGEQLVVTTRIRGDINATLHMAGLPVYDPGTKAISIDQFDYQVLTKNVVMKMANNYFYEELLEYFRSYLNLPLEKEITALPEIISGGIDRSNVGQKIEVNFSQLTVQLIEHKITASEIQLLLRAQGAANMHLHQKAFAKKKSP
jgi:hypothetical protein